MSSPADVATFAVRDDASLGREHAETFDTNRGPFHVDRQRVLQSTALRRLEYKTQVFAAAVHDHFRTRLTHTLEVAEVSRRLAVALNVNECLAETIAMAHDLGHPPFGHAGEAALNECMRDYGGFEHNSHSLRVVDYLEHPFPAFRGLNLSFEVREGLAKHETRYDKPDAANTNDAALATLRAVGPMATIEGQIACIADRLAYDSHDLEDAFGAALIDESDLSGVTLWTEAAGPIRARYPDLPLAAVRRPILNRLTDLLIDDAVAESSARIKGEGIQTVDDVRNSPAAVIGMSAGMDAVQAQLEDFMLERVYRHERLVEMDAHAERVIRELFAAFVADPSALPPRFGKRVGDQPLERVICDYIAGMTDRYCQAEHDRTVGASDHPIA